MEIFRPVRGGIGSRAEPAERALLLRVVTDVAMLLGADPDDDSTAAEPAGEEDVLAALDFTPGDAGPAGDRPPADPALHRLLPDMAQDGRLSGELREMTEPALRAEKIANLRLVQAELMTPTGPHGELRIRTGQEGAWLKALNDVRLVLAVRLGVDDDESAEEVYERASEALADDGERADSVGDSMAIIYSSLTWWQESLLDALTRRPRPN